MKKVCFVLAVFVVASTLKLNAQVSTDSSSFQNPVGDSIVAFAKTFLGTPYKYASASPKNGFDCSGLTWYVFNHYGIAVPRSAKEYKKFGKEIPISEARKGDIIVFRGTHPADKSSGHVGIVISNPGEPLQFIHASSSKKHSGVVITEYAKSAYPKRFIKIVRAIK
jgi:cell wall-associated NlpC family hydrolase